MGNLQQSGDMVVYLSNGKWTGTPLYSCNLDRYAYRAGIGVHAGGYTWSMRHAPSRTAAGSTGVLIGGKPVCPGNGIADSSWRKHSF